MIRKVELHMDALVVIALLFIAAVGFIVYQRHQYSILAQDNLGRQMRQLSLELEVARLEALLKKATQAGPEKRSTLKGGTGR